MIAKKTHREKSQDEASLSGSDHTTESGADDAAVDSPKEDELKDGGIFVLFRKHFTRTNWYWTNCFLKRTEYLTNAAVHRSQIYITCSGLKSYTAPKERA